MAGVPDDGVPITGIRGKHGFRAAVVVNQERDTGAGEELERVRAAAAGINARLMRGGIVRTEHNISVAARLGRRTPEDQLTSNQPERPGGRGEQSPPGPRREWLSRPFLRMLAHHLPLLPS